MVIPSLFGRRERLGDSSAGSEHLFSRSKVLLNDISGEARDDELVAVLGASGSGKSTLIDALANRIAKGSLKETVTLNGEQLESKLLKVISAYMMQDDLLFPILTVEKTLMFAAEFRLPRTFSKSKKKLRVQVLIDQLGLRNAAKTVIGDEGHRGVSGGKPKRSPSLLLRLYVCSPIKPSHQSPLIDQCIFYQCIFDWYKFDNMCSDEREKEREER
ncbi:hypothetical protein L2E82_15230 [Cichorium intybus]|uniref:Uncharacterized protein n=1 Tax=Cichorium intybus TaxID=13427 RepID=A0ACB9F286_CICIN|nr:hypothetical protein L2E82_15230 [Cichorium intybus]